MAGKGSVPAALILALLLALAAPAQAAEGDLRPLLPMMEAVSRSDWPAAHGIAGSSGHRLAPAIARWLDYSSKDTKASPAAIQAFLEQHPGWPRRAAMRRNAEAAMLRGSPLPAAALSRWIEEFGPPLEGNFAALAADRLRAGGREAEATAMLRRFWAERVTPLDQQTMLLRYYGGLLRPADHSARFDKLMTARAFRQCDALLPLMSASEAAIGRARLALARQDAGVDGMLARLPAAARADSRLAYERLVWRRKAKDEAGALAILDSKPSGGQPGPAWWKEREAMARAAAKRGDFATAWRLAAGHGKLDGRPLEEAETLAGWLALKHRRDPATALRHFEAGWKAADRGTAQARAAWWAAEAAAKLGSGERQWLERAAAQPLTWFGQLALARLGKPLRLPPAPPATAAQRRAFEALEPVRAARMLITLGRTDLAAELAGHLAETTETPAERMMAAELGVAMERPTVAIRAERAANRAGSSLGPIGWPLYSLPPQLRVDAATLHGLIRQESGFDSNAVSHAGARGLMQLMPSTARMVANGLGLPYEMNRLSADPAYNLTLGSTYLAQMLDKYGGSLPLALAAYNAGPGRANDWIARFGDPRANPARLPEWVESVPYDETRGYIQRVMENAAIYRAVLASRNAAE